MACFLDLISQGKVNVQKLITHRFKIDDALKGYEMILSGKEPYLGVLLEYGEVQESKKRIELRAQNTEHRTEEKMSNVEWPMSKFGIGFIGAGLHANTSLLPALKKFKKEARLIGIANTSGYKGRHAGLKYGFEYAVSDYHELLNDKNINAIIISTRHNLHAQMIVDSLNSGKHVFVEKPLCVNYEELKNIIALYDLKHKEEGLQLMVGFNRRFAPYSTLAKQLLGNASDMVINCRVNAGFVPADSWIHDSTEGGGRVIGEVCHFVDLMQYLTGSLPISVYAEATDIKGEDNVLISLKFKNGSIGTILYSSQGDKMLPRERFEIFSGKSVCVIDNFKSLFFAKDGKIKKKSSFSLDRGFNDEFKAFFVSLKEGKPVVDFKEYVYTTLTTFAIIESIKTRRPIEIDALANSL